MKPNPDEPLDMLSKMYAQHLDTMNSIPGPALQQASAANYAADLLKKHPATHPSTDPTFKVRKIRNGYVLWHAKFPGAVPAEDFCADMNEVGDRVTALLVQYELEK